MSDPFNSRLAPDNCLIIHLKRDGKDVVRRFLKLEHIGDPEKQVFELHLDILKKTFYELPEHIGFKKDLQAG